MRNPSARLRTLRRITIVLVSLFIGAAAVSPVFAANGVSDADRGAMVLVATFALLLSALVYEVWRLTRLEQLPASRRKNRH